MKEAYKDFDKHVIKPSLVLIKYTLILFVGFLLFASFSNALTGYEYLNASTVSYWKLDEGTGTNTVDSVRNINGTINSGTWNTTSVINNSLSFVNGNIINPNYAVNVIRPLTINIWVKAKHTTSNTVFTDNASINNGLLYARSTTEISFYTGGEYAILKKFNETNFEMYTIVVNASGNTTFYVNGVSYAKTTGTGVTNPNFSSIKFAQGFTNPLVGTIDEISLFNKTLNETEINYLYNGGNPGVEQRYPFTNSTPLVEDNTSITLISQSPSDITNMNAIYGVNITYNYVINNFVNTSPYLNYSIKNSTGNIVYSYINGSQQPGYVIVNYTNNTGTNYRFILDDNIYPATYNYNETLMEDTVHYNYSLNNILQMLKVQFLNVTPRKYDIIEMYISMTNPNTFTDAYYCNETYSSGLVGNNPNCVFIGSFNFSNNYNHCHNLSCHNIFSMGILNGSYKNITVTPTSYIVVSGAGLGTVNVGYINGSVRPNVSMYSSNRGIAWSNLDITIDAHMHTYDDNMYIEYNAYGSNTSNLINSVSTIDAFNITLLPPSGIDVLVNSNNYYYDSTGLITRSDSTAYTGNISYYKYVILDANYTLYDTLNSSTNDTSINFYPFNYTSGYYYAGVYAFDTNGYSSLSLSPFFSVSSEIINPCNETVTLNSTGVSVYFNFTKNNNSEDVSIYGRLGLLEYYLTDTIGVNVFIGEPGSITYDLFTRENIDVNSSCYLTFCTNTWTPINNPCIEGFRLINYSYSCPLPYDYPSDYGTYEECTSPVNTDKELWLVLLLFGLWLLCLILGLTVNPLVNIVTVIISFALAYYTNIYFDNPIIAFGLVVVSALMFFVSIAIKRYMRD